MAVDTLLGGELFWKLLPTAFVKDWIQGHTYTNLSLADMPLCSLELEAGVTIHKELHIPPSHLLAWPKRVSWQQRTENSGCGCCIPWELRRSRGQITVSRGGWARLDGGVRMAP